MVHIHNLVQGLNLQLIDSLLPFLLRVLLASSAARDSTRILRLGAAAVAALDPLKLLARQQMEGGLLLSLL